MQIIYSEPLSRLGGLKLSFAAPAASPSGLHLMHFLVYLLWPRGNFSLRPPVLDCFLVETTVMHHILIIMIWFLVWFYNEKHILISKKSSEKPKVKLKDNLKGMTFSTQNTSFFSLSKTLNLKTHLIISLPFEICIYVASQCVSYLKTWTSQLIKGGVTCYTSSSVRAVGAPGPH